ncbi:hypothetical protein KJ671_03245 [Patescibacteria group bacterium]|nr:hypothetical protein [Patescibacteria group bacterium]
MCGMNRLNKILLISILLLAIVLAIIIWKPSIFASITDKPYYAVYLLSGDLYFGQMSWCRPSILSDARLIQQAQNVEEGQPDFSLVEFKDVFWGPAGDLKLNKNNVLWISRLSDESQVVKLINANN